MKKSEWSDKQLMELLKQMPKIQDHRDPRDIYRNLSLKKRKYPNWMLPSIATAAASLIVMILVPRFINNQQFSYDKAGEEKISVEKRADISGNKEETILMKKQESPSEKREFSIASQPKLLKTGSSKTALYADEVGEGTVLTYWIPDQQAQLLVPVSTIVNDNKHKSWLTIFSDEMSQLKEQEWGLSDIYPINATLSIDNNDNSVKVDVPLNHEYGQGSSNETMFLNVLKKDIGTNSKIKRMKLYTNGQQGIDFSNYGNTKAVDIESDFKHAYFFYKPKTSGSPFLVPTSLQYKDIQTALAAMEQDSELSSGLKASLPSHYLIEINTENNILYLTINPSLIIKNDSAALNSFEAILLTAKDFGMQKVFIKNSPIQKLGPFDLTKVVDVPIAPNYRSIH
jgi:hypothetical protein